MDSHQLQLGSEFSGPFVRLGIFPCMNAPVPTNWREFFDLQAATFDENDFAQNSRVEVQFLRDLVELAPGARVLDLGCGTGRHATVFADQGYEVTGVDFSPAMIAAARSKGSAATFVEADVREFRDGSHYDLVVMLCEGPLNTLGQGEDPVAHALAVLETISEHLAPTGTAVFTALNAYAQIRAMRQEDVDVGAFNPVTMQARYANDMVTKAGVQTVCIEERLFLPSELVAMAFHRGLEITAVYGGTAGNWGQRTLELDEIEAMFVARRRPV